MNYYIYDLWIILHMNYYDFFIFICIYELALGEDMQFG